MTDSKEDYKLGQEILGYYGRLQVSVRYAARTDRNGHKHSDSARLDAVFIEL